MRIPLSYQEAYDSAKEVAEELDRFAGNRLRLLASENGWLFDSRIKSAVSCLSKIESDGYQSFLEIHDLYAAMIVVPTVQEIDKAMSELSKNFKVETKVRSTQDPGTFRYDDLHVLATLDGVVSPNSMQAAARTFKFEIQVRTGLQYAWWRATHDQIYKNTSELSIAWPIQRTSSQARAMLELLDGIIGDFSRASEAGRTRTEPSEESNADSNHVLSEIVNVWSKSQRPDDVLRFARTITKLADACDKPLEDVRDRLLDADMTSIRNSGRLTPVQLFSFALHEMCGHDFAEMLEKAGIKMFVTDELIEEAPSMSSLPPSVVVRLRKDS